MDYPSFLVRNEEQDSIVADEVLLAARQLTHISRWIDGYGPNAERPLEAQLWNRTMKGGEEHGEVVAAMIAYTGQNPRKGQSGTLAEVEKELLDEVVSALGAIQHLRDVHGHDGPSPLEALFRHLEFLHTRAGLDG
jgi:hypothetical protein